ncbi:hypothetical protein Nepgr_031815 [Nepenthes gracilis]|uniref:Uncharacterized protein n=1 Tax=Nepenthes gracilis TaxID=150966 RepID=A0AAD3TJI3_NEPGR|nr:hypothetical protein Nepgr_031815 [Nepenthes gracilis]
MTRASQNLDGGAFHEVAVNQQMPGWDYGLQLALSRQPEKNMMLYRINQGKSYSILVPRKSIVAAAFLRMRILCPFLFALKRHGFGSLFSSKIKWGFFAYILILIRVSICILVDLLEPIPELIVLACFDTIIRCVMSLTCDT